MVSQMKDKQQIVEILRQASTVAIFIHAAPDGDGVGSMLALGLALERLGKKVMLYCPDPAPKNLQFLPGVERLEKPNPSALETEICLFLDCSDLQRVKIESEEIPAKIQILNIDHHISNKGFGTWNWVDAEAAATGEMVYDLITALGVTIEKDIATNIYTAIVTDTGSFQYSNTTVKTHRLAADLMGVIDLFSIHHPIFDQKPLAQIKLLQKALGTLELTDQGQLAFIMLRWADFVECGADESLSEGLSNFACSIEGVEAAVVLRETESGLIKAGLRSNEWLDVNQVAAQFNGGGHRKAAGCTFAIPLNEARMAIESSLREALAIGRNH